MKKIGILGCGWLGLSLGKQLLDQGNIVRGSTTSKDKLKRIKKEGLEAYAIQINPISITGDLDFFKDLEVLIVSIAPGRKQAKKINFSAIIEQCCLTIAHHKIPRVIFLSSISVYGNQEGELDETALLKPHTDVGKHLVKSEEKIQTLKCSRVILRLGGLIGPDRHPIHQLSGKKVENPKGFINLIHKQDAVGILTTLIENPLLTGIYNGVSPSHPTRKIYYTEMARRKGLTPPEFINQGHCIKSIDGKKIESESRFKYSILNLLI